jgi:hypothetical protein
MPEGSPLMRAVEVPPRPHSRALLGIAASWLTLVVAFGIYGLLNGNIINPGMPLIAAGTSEPIVGSAVLLADHVTIAYTDPHGICRGPELTVTESPTRVSLALTETDDRLTECTWGLRNMVEVFLAAPLGSRALVDALTGHPVPYFDMQRGLYLSYTTDWSPSHGGPSGLVATDSPYFRSPGAAIMVEDLTKAIQQNDGSRMITEAQLIQVSGGGWHPPPGTVTRPVTVRGYPGLAAAGIIVWTEHGITVALQGYGPSPAPTATPYILDGILGGPPMGTAQLMTLSDDLSGVAS